MSLKDRTIFITGASRGIGKAIALEAAREGAKIIIAAKTAEPHPRLPGTIYTAAEEIEAAGGQALPCIVDVRDEASVQAAVQAGVEAFGGIDILVNNASAISLTPTLQTPMKRYDLMNSVNARGTYLCSQVCLPQLLQSDHPHILNISPPLTLNPRWYAPHLAYTLAKMGMSFCVLGMAEEFKGRVGVNALWPRTGIATAAVSNLLGGQQALASCRTPKIMGEAALAILKRDPRSCTGQFFIDDAVLQEEGVEDFDVYAVSPGTPLMPDFFLD